METNHTQRKPLNNVKPKALAGLLSFCFTALPHTSSAELPNEVIFKNNQQTFNSVYYSAIQDGEIWVKPNTLSTGQMGPWQQLELPEGLAGDVQEITSDDEHIIAINSQLEIYTMWKALDGIERFKWQKAWGFPFWFGPGHTLDDSLLKWDFSVVSPRFDDYYTDPAGNHIPVGFAKVSHIIGLKPDGRNVSYNDPWLATDWSYEICGPERGLFPIHAQSASGSTTFVMGESGDMYTRIYDFDLSGHNDLFKYSYDDQSGQKRAKLPQIIHSFVYAVQLPAYPWVKQPKIQGRITDRISIHKIGKGVVNRILRVEGWDEQGNGGYYEKELIQTESSDWVFYPSDEPIQGTEVNNMNYDSSRDYLLDSEGINFSRPAKTGFWAWLFNNDWSASVKDLDPYCSPATLTITSRDDEELNLLLHGRETIRLTPRERGLNHKPFKLNGAIEVPSEIWDNQDNLNPTHRKLIRKHFKDSRFRKVTLTATTSTLKVFNNKLSDIIQWKFEADD